MRLRAPYLRLTRDGVLFLSGLAGIAHETLFATSERPTLLLLFAGMCGLPMFLRVDEAKRAADTPGPSSTSRPSSPRSSSSSFSATEEDG